MLNYIQESWVFRSKVDKFNLKQSSRLGKEENIYCLSVSWQFSITSLKLINKGELLKSFK